MYLIGNFDPLEVLAYVGLWCSLYCTLRWINPTRTPEWQCRVVTVVHACVISALALYSAFVLGPWPFTDAGGPNDEFQVRTVALCLGYFLFDVAWSLYFHTEGAVMLAHHSLSLIGLFWCLITGYYGTEAIATIAGAEVTNPLLQARWFLRSTGRQHTLAADVIELVFMLAFGSLRLGVGSVLLYRYYQQDTTTVGRFGGTNFYIISVIFFVNIVTYVTNKYTKRYTAWVKTKKSKSAAEIKARSSDDLGSVRIKGISSVSLDSAGVKGTSCTHRESVGVMKDNDIPGPRELKDGLEGLTVRRHCMVTKAD